MTNDKAGTSLKEEERFAAATFKYSHSPQMQRFAANPLNTLLKPGLSFRLTAHCKPTQTNSVSFRSFSLNSFRTNGQLTLPKRPSMFSLPLAFRGARTVMTDSVPVVTRPNSAEAWKKLGITAATIAGTVFLADAFLNRETREGLSDAEQSYLNDSFKYTAGGLVLTALAARSLFKSGFAVRVMSANPWVVLGVSLVGSIGSMMGVYYTPPEQSMQKHLFWLAFNACQAATLSPLFFVNPAVLSRAALYTCGVVGSLSYVGATAKNDTFLYMGGPLLAGVTVVALSSLAPMALPLGMRGLAVAEALSLYGGLAVFGGFVLYDTQKILHHARMAERGVIPRDPMKEAISLELDMINIFVRLVQILMMQNNRKK